VIVCGARKIGERVLKLLITAFAIALHAAESAPIGGAL
jgi:hypothetical protein